jgi:hypothetical protein
VQQITVTIDIIIDWEKVSLSVPFVRDAPAYHFSRLLRINDITSIRIMDDSIIHLEHRTPTHFERAKEALPEF